MAGARRGLGDKLQNKGRPAPAACAALGLHRTGLDRYLQPVRPPESSHRASSSQVAVASCPNRGRDLLSQYRVGEKGSEAGSEEAAKWLSQKSVKVVPPHGQPQRGSDVQREDAGREPRPFIHSALSRASPELRTFPSLFSISS